MAYGGLPDFSTFLSNQNELNAATAPAPQAPEATGTGNWLTAGLGSGYHGALASVGGFGEALARAAGYDTGADAAARYADSERAAAATYARPDLEAAPWYSPGGLGYRLAQMAPGVGLGIAGAVAGAALAPEEGAAAALTGVGGLLARNAPAIGGSLGAYPLVVGENVQRRKDYAGELSQGQAAKALAFGVPEAALQGVVPGKLEGMLAGNVGEGLVKTVRNTALTQLPVGAATEYLTQQMGDPNRPFADRAQDIVNAALQGAVMGGITAGVVHPISAAAHALAKTPVANVTNGSLFDFLNKAFNPVEPSQPVPPPQLALPAPDAFNRPQLQAPQFFSGPRTGEQPEGVSRVPSEATVLRPDQSRPVQETVTTPLLEPPQNFAGERSVRGMSEAEREDLRVEQNQVRSGEVIQSGPPSTWRGMAEATEQKPLTLEEIKAQAANSNEPPTNQPPTPQAPVNTRLATQAAENDNKTGRGPVQPAAEQQPLPLAKPGEAPVGNTPTLTGKVTPQEPVKGPITTQEGLRKAGLAPVDVGKETTNAPANRNVEGPGATREATPQGDVVKPAEPGAPANDKFDQTPFQSDLNKLADLRKQTFNTTDDAQKAVAQAVITREASGRPAPPALERVAKALGVIKDDGSIDPKFTGAAETPEGPHETLEAGVQAPEAPSINDIPKQHQGRFNRLQELRDQLGDNLSDPETFGLVKRVTDLQNELQDVKGSNRTGEINGEIKTLQGDVAKRATGPEAPPSDPKALASSTAPTPDAAQFIAERQGAPTTGEARARARKSGKAPEQPREPVKTLPENIPAVNPLEAAQDAEAQARMSDEGGPAPREAPVPAQTQEAARKAAKGAAAPTVDRTLEAGFTAKTQEATAKAAKAAQREARMQAQRDKWDAAHETGRAERSAARDAAYAKEAADREAAGLPPKTTREALGELSDEAARMEKVKRAKNESQIAQAVQAEIAKPTPKTPPTPQITDALNIARDTLEALKKNPPPGVNATRINFNKNIAAHEQQLAVLEKAVREGGLEALQNFRRDHFDDNLWTDALGKMMGPGEVLLRLHAEAETKLMDQIAGLRGERPLVRYETQPTVHDVNLANVINATGKVGDALEFIRQHDPSPMNRMMASVLGRLGLDTSIRMASDERLLEDTTRKLGEGEVIAGSHNDQLNRISVYDGSNVSRTVLHEAFHAATVRALASGSRAASEMRGLFDTLKARAGGGTFYGLTNPEEMVAEAHTNPTFQQFLRSEPVETGSRLGNMWQSFKNAMFKTLGMPERVRTAFDQVMDGTQKLMAENPTRAAITGDRPLLVERGIKAMANAVDAFGNEKASQLAREAEGWPSKIARSLRDGVLGWIGGRDIAEMNRKEMPTQSRYVEAGIKTEDRVDTFYKTAAAALHATQGVSKKGEDLINKVAARILQGIDGTKKWDEHTHLKDNPKADVLKEQHAEAARDVHALRQVDGGKAWKAFTAMRDEYAAKFSGNNVHQLWDYTINHHPELVGKVKGFESNPFDQYDRAYAAHDDPSVALQFMRGKEADLHQGLKAVHSDLLKARDKLAAQIKADDKAGAANALPRDVRKDLDAKYADAKQQFGNLDGLLKDIDAGNERQAQAPYAHIGRDGEHFVAADLTTDGNGVVKEEAIDALGKMLQEKGFKDVAVLKGLTSNKFYVRLGSETERKLMVEELAKLKGHVVDGSIKRGLADNQGIFDALSSSRMREIVEAAKANKPEYPAGATDAQRTAIDRAHSANVSELMRSLVEMLPKSSLDRLYQRREGVQGFNSNMVQNFRSASDKNARGLANLTMAAENGQRVREMRDEMKRLQGDTSVPENRLTALQQSYNELLARRQGVSTYSTTAALDAFRKLGHITSVGMSPAYVMALGSQMGTLTLPHFGARHGFVRSAQTMAGVTGDTLKMVSAVARGPDATTFGVRQSVLDGAKIDPKLVQFHMDMARRGAYNKGYTEAMTGHDASSGAAKVMHYANAMGRYAEMVPRVQAALMARKLYNEDLAKWAKDPSKPKTGVIKEFGSAEDYAVHAVNETQLDWHQANTARQTSRAGMFGVMSPIINQFMGYQTRLSAKIYREVHGALGGDATSQKWLLGHAAAVAVLSGTLGLPMVAVAASVYDKLADWVTGQDDHDVIASYRTYLASAFGKELGEVIARGAPRAIGVDFDHAGEGKIFPGSTTVMMLTEKRKLEDAEKDWLKAEGGHAVGLMFHLAFAARDIANGDYLDASEKMVPELFKGPLEAYRLNERNFVDKNGQRLPISANATDIMMTAMGIDPAKEAEYNEEQRTATGLNAMRQARSQNITRHLLLAQSRGDGEMFQDWERQATQFQLDHPGMSGPLQDFGRSLSQHVRATALAKGFGTPLGVKQRDVVGRGMTSFGNLRDQ